MKKFYRFCGLALFLGLIMVLVGVMNNGVKPVVDNHDHFTFTVISGSARTRNLSTSNNFQKVNVQTSFSNVYLHSGNKYKIKVTGENPNAIKAKVTNNRLDISESEPISIKWHNLSSRIDITIPKSYEITAIGSGSESGNIKLQNLKAKDIFATSHGGNVDVNNITAKTTEFATYEGKNLNIKDSLIGKSLITMHGGWLKIANSQLTADAKTHASNITITNSKLSNKNVFEMLQSGDFRLTKSPNISYQLSSGSKLIRFKGSKPYASFKKRLSKKNKLIVDNSDGKITIE